ncbi:PREDICTED: uncharacterized protein LOC109582898 [Amphimedon queenslandica]|uniref:Uncharacterized protein n=1 Tax=Amphimedon queenslandica TaxID=400682 RepID=A0AAN0J9W6_AMPQE|nr:PREDICTED: uncharacterized protein LOC109582898 [Amphimedon queenslandica]|eukprot:XP_019853521.1 PREDICTED: uncharacterized protein LOC109582898 [Amphimedon queenslandica]
MHNKHSDKMHDLKDVCGIKDIVFPVDRQLINWEEYGIRINFPKKYLSSMGAHLAVHVTPLAGGKFAFPENTILVSTVYAVSTSIPIPMRLELQHCIDPTMTRYLKFATASINSCSPYQFSFKKEGKFQSDSWYGSFNFDANCFICILGLKEVPEDDKGSKQKQKGHAMCTNRPDAQQSEGEESEKKRRDDKSTENGQSPSTKKSIGVEERSTQTTHLEEFVAFVGLLFKKEEKDKDIFRFFAVKNLNALLKVRRDII